MPPNKNSKEPPAKENGASPGDYDRRELGRKIYKKLIDKGWSQSDLAEQLFGREVDDRGRNVAKGRDLVSKWVRGVAYPGPSNLHKIARALGMEPEDLAPAFSGPSADRRMPEREIKGVPGRPDMAILTIYQQAMSWNKAMKIMQILQEDD